MTKELKEIVNYLNEQIDGKNKKIKALEDDKFRAKFSRGQVFVLTQVREHIKKTYGV